MESEEAALEALWKHVLDHWDQDKAHAAFLDHCRENERLVEAAVRYRGMSGDSQRGEVAERQLKAVTVLALANLEVARSPAPRARGDAAKLILVAFFIAATLGICVYMALS